MSSGGEADATGWTDALIGRQYETQKLEALVSHVEDCGGAVLVRGEVGTGKSILLAATGSFAESRGMQVCRVSGVRAEMDVPFAGCINCCDLCSTKLRTFPGLSVMCCMPVWRWIARRHETRLRSGWQASS
jgi:hypothetical protein